MAGPLGNLETQRPLAINLVTKNVGETATVTDPGPWCLTVVDTVVDAGVSPAAVISVLIIPPTCSRHLGYCQYRAM